MSAKEAIVITGNPRGQFLEGIVDGTPKPGTVMQVEAAVEPVNGKYSWQVYNVAADGNQRIIAVLLPDSLQGKLTTDAYVDNDPCFLYCPVPGEVLNMLVANIAGTGDTFAIGDVMMVDDGTGKLIDTTGTPESEPFVIMETKATALTADALVECMFTGY